MHKSKLGGFIIDCRTDDLGAAADFWGQRSGCRFGTFPARKVRPTGDSRTAMASMGWISRCNRSSTRAASIWTSRRTTLRPRCGGSRPWARNGFRRCRPGGSWRHRPGSGSAWSRQAPQISSNAPPCGPNRMAVASLSQNGDIFDIAQQRIYGAEGLDFAQISDNIGIIVVRALLRSLPNYNRLLNSKKVERQALLCGASSA